MLTKSDYLRYLDCPLHCWLYKFRKDLRPEVSETDQARFDQGYEVEEYAKKLFPSGTNVVGYSDTGKGETIECVKNGCKTIFQATAMPENLLARADIFHKNEETGKWDIYEVKSSTQIKEEYAPDLTFQRIAFERDGYDIGRTYLIRVNGEYVRDGEIEIEKLFVIEDLTKDVENLRSIVESDIPKALALLAKSEDEVLSLGYSCKSPKNCSFPEYCFPGLPEYSVFDIRHMKGAKLEGLKAMKVLDIFDVPDNYELTPPQQNQVMVAKNGKPMIDIEEIQATLGSLEYPLYFLDYETYSSAIPIFDGTKPYQQVTFQYSLHVMKEPNGELEHFEYLHTESSNPLKPLAEKLSQDIGSTGSVIVWNKSFEMGRNKEIAETLPEFSDFMESVNYRVFDLMEIFSKQLYVHPDFRGSYSIKKVLPVLVPELSYEKLEDVQNGGVASLYWFKHVFSNSADKDRIVDGLLKYCELDTLAMVEIFRVLEKV